VLLVATVGAVVALADPDVVVVVVVEPDAADGWVFEHPDAASTITSTPSSHLTPADPR
jgi:hypothetical protein